MASVSPKGERSVLALLAELYAEIVELREALAAERRAHAETVARLDELRAAVREEAQVPDGS